MSAANFEKKLIREAESGDWTIHITTIAQILIAIVAIVGIGAWATLFPILILTFLFLEPLLIIGIILFIIAAAFSQRTLLVEHFSAGDVVIREGGPGDFVYTVRSGELEGQTTEGGINYTQKFGPGDCFGVSAVVGRHPYRVTVTAKTDVQVVRIDPTDLAAVAASGPQFEESLRSLLDAKVGELIGPRAKPAA